MYALPMGRTNVDAVKHSFKDAQNVYQNLLGFVLNKANIDRLVATNRSAETIIKTSIIRNTA